MADIVVTEFMDEAAVRRLGRSFETLYDPALVDRPGDLLKAVVRARALIVRNRTQVDAALVAAAPRLRCVGRLGVGLDNIDLAACAARAVIVYPATGANDLAVAEYVIAAAMILLRGAYHATAEVAGGRWPRQALIGREMSGKTMGLVGLGSVAREVARRAGALGMKVAACDPYLPDGHGAWKGARRLAFEALLAQADVVSLHVPLTSATRHMIDRHALSRMKPDAVLINTARGGVLDAGALAAALRGGRLAGAALDVFEDEPLGARAGATFAGLPNLLLTPHIAGVTQESNVRVSNRTADAVLAHLAADGA